MDKLNTDYLRLITQHQGSIYGYIRSVAPGIPIDDILQETNIALWDKADTFTMGTNFKAFAFRIAYLKTLEFLRHRKRDHWLVFDSELVERIDSYQQSEETENSHQSALRECLSNLGEADQTLIHERYTKGQTVRRIAQVHQRPEGSMQQAFFRIRNALRDCIERRITRGEPTA